jgi:hypothetical protein
MAKAIGTVRSTDLNHKGQGIRCSSGGGMTFTSAKGLGAVMIADLETASLTLRRFIGSTVSLLPVSVWQIV